MISSYHHPLCIALRLPMAHPPPLETPPSHRITSIGTYAEISGALPRWKGNLTTLKLVVQCTTSSSKLKVRKVPNVQIFLEKRKGGHLRTLHAYWTNASVIIFISKRNSESKPFSVRKIGSFNKTVSDVLHVSKYIFYITISIHYILFKYIYTTLYYHIHIIMLIYSNIKLPPESHSKHMQSVSQAWAFVELDLEWTPPETIWT